MWVMLFRWCVYLALLVMAGSVGAAHDNRRERRQAGSSCVSSAGRPGLCGGIRSCQPLVRLLQEAKRGGSAARAALGRLRQETARCPFRGSTPQVCCETGGATGGQGDAQFNAARPATQRPQGFNPGRGPPARPLFFVNRPSQTTQRPFQPFTQRPAQPFTQRPAQPFTQRPIQQFTQRPAQPFTQRPAQPFTQRPAQPFTQRPAQPFTQRPAQPFTQRPAQPFTQRPAQPFTQRPTRRPLTSVGRQPLAQSVLPDENVCGRRTFSTRIFNGQDADIGSWPWAASIGYRDNSNGEFSWACGATLITDRYLVTAAHCLTNTRSFRPVIVRLGELDFNREPDCLRDNPSVCADPHQDVAIASIKTHPGYGGLFRNAHADDIALVRLVRSVQFTEFIRPICLPLDLSRFKEGTDNANGQKVYAVGWGRSSDEDVESFTPILQEVVLDVVPASDCENAFRSNRQLTSFGKRLCVSGVSRGADTCNGDSGGPLMVPDRFGVNWYLTGVTSFGARNCGTREAVFTRVHEYLDWIRSNIS
ncbi:Phenoloxidase-activating factor 3 [Amphibalanus amphitrite]|uniref:CLIP domain-containing serine protease n=1 Tax=Amphibalanus amphitrite TaxID=1232801 RepID=A0A6A4VC53_AMPAM|nr:CLIP domain-containing serine protease 14D-like [Amphibalanus amphitrite]KAF0292076.1 Phenoloxidase-activating factor 3 [Amphibalanus amphitrite]